MQNPQPLTASQSSAADSISTEYADLSKAPSVYFDGGFSSSAALEQSLTPDDPDDDTITAIEEVQPPFTDSRPPSTWRKNSRASRAQRLATEQAIWVREKFSLPTDDVLLASFSAAMLRSILLQGRIHITTSSICFYAKIFGRTTKESFPFTSIRRVKKRRGGFIANAVKVVFLDPATPAVVFGSLNHRERAYSIIQERLRELNPSAAESRDSDDTTSAASAGPDSEDRSVEETDFPIENVARNRVNHDDTLAQANTQTSSADVSSQQRNGLNSHPGASDTASELSSRKSSDVDTISRVEPNIPSESTPPLVWRTADDVVNRFAGNSHEKKSERARGVLNAPVIQAFNMLFVGNWLQCYHDTSNNRDATFSEWYRAQDGYMTRDVSFRRPLGYKIGPKETRVKEKQRYSFTTNGSVIIELEGQNLDAPYGDYFVVESFFELIPHDNGTKTLFVASIAVHFSKSTILRGKIESGALTETKLAFQKIIDLASRHIEENTVPYLQLPNRQANKRSNERTTLDLVLPSSPTKKMRSSDALVIPTALQSQPAIQNIRSSDNESGENGGSSVVIRTVSSHVQNRQNEGTETKKVDANIEIRDSQSTNTLRILGTTALLLACFLLLGVLILLTRMQNNMSVLEKLLTERLHPAPKCRRY